MFKFLRASRHGPFLFINLMYGNPYHIPNERSRSPSRTENVNRLGREARTDSLVSLLKPFEQEG